MLATSTPSAVILVAEDDLDLRTALTMQLQADGYTVIAAPHGQAALALAERCPPDLAIIDLMMPVMGGAELAPRLANLGDIPIIVLTAFDEEERRVEALERYAQDFVSKPCSYRELRVRIKHLLSAHWAAVPPSTRTRLAEGVWLDREHRHLVRDGVAPMRLTPIETRLLEIFAANAGRVLPTRVLLDRVWPCGAGTAQSLWEYIRRLRRKLGMRRGESYYITAVPGVGYRWRKPDAVAAWADPA